MKHLAVFDDQAIKKIKDGQKTLDIRLSQKRILPFGKIVSGDQVLVKQSGGEVIGKFKVKRVISFDNLCPEQVRKIKKDYNHFIKMDPLFWHEKENAKFGTLIYMEDFHPVLIPLQVKKRDRRPWVVM